MFELLEKAKDEQWSLDEFVLTLIDKFGKSHAFQFLVSQGYFDSIEAIEEWINRDWYPGDSVFYFDCNPESTYKPS